MGWSTRLIVIGIATASTSTCVGLAGLEDLTFGTGGGGGAAGGGGGGGGLGGGGQGGGGRGGGTGTPSTIRVVAGSTAGAIAERTFDPTDGTWTPVTQVADVGGGDAVRWVITPPAVHTHSQPVAVVSGSTTTPKLDLFLRDAEGDYTLQWQVPSLPRAEERRVDVAIERVSGDVLVVYADETDVPLFRAYAGGEWTDEAKVAPSNPANEPLRWIRLVSSPHSDEITLLFVASDGQLRTRTWDGSVFSAEVPIDPIVLDETEFENFDAAYERESGDLLVVYASAAESSPRFVTRPMASATFTMPASLPGAWAGAGESVLSAEAGSDRIALVSMENDDTCGNCTNLGVAIWNGSDWTDVIDDIESDADEEWLSRPGRPPVAVAWRGETGTAIGTFQLDVTTRLIDWFAWNEGDGWTSSPPFPASPGHDDIHSYQMLSVPESDDVLLYFHDELGDIYAKTYGAGAWQNTEGGAPLFSGHDVFRIPYAAARVP